MALSPVFAPPVGCKAVDKNSLKDATFGASYRSARNANSARAFEEKWRMEICYASSHRNGSPWRYPPRF